MPELQAPSAKKLHQAESWAKQALGIIEKTRDAPAGASARHEAEACELALAATLFNHGIIQEVIPSYLHTYHQH